VRSGTIVPRVGPVSGKMDTVGTRQSVSLAGLRHRKVGEKAISWHDCPASSSAFERRLSGTRVVCLNAIAVCILQGGLQHEF